MVHKEKVSLGSKMVTKYIIMYGMARLAQTNQRWPKSFPICRVV